MICTPKKVKFLLNNTLPLLFYYLPIVYKFIFSIFLNIRISYIVYYFFVSILLTIKWEFLIELLDTVYISLLDFGKF